MKDIEASLYSFCNIFLLCHLYGSQTPNIAWRQTIGSKFGKFRNMCRTDWNGVRDFFGAHVAETVVKLDNVCKKEERSAHVQWSSQSVVLTQSGIVADNFAFLDADVRINTFTRHQIDQFVAFLAVHGEGNVPFVGAEGPPVERNSIISSSGKCLLYTHRSADPADLISYSSCCLLPLATDKVLPSTLGLLLLFM